jgi:hypothetical protein
LKDKIYDVDTENIITTNRRIISSIHTQQRLHWKHNEDDCRYGS